MVFDIFDKGNGKKKTQNERDADEIKVTGAIITTDKKVGTKGKKTVTQTDVWSEGAEIKALVGATMEDKPRPKKGKGKFTNSKIRNTDWNKPLNAPAEKPKPKPVGTWGDEKKTRVGTWGSSAPKKGSGRAKRLIGRHEAEDPGGSESGEYERGEGRAGQAEEGERQEEARKTE